jgi:hypothetical protein
MAVGGNYVGWIIAVFGFKSAFTRAANSLAKCLSLQCPHFEEGNRAIRLYDKEISLF